jgi:uncharacterized repeat protein (TIGR04052 family)
MLSLESPFPHLQRPIPIVLLAWAVSLSLLAGCAPAKRAVQLRFSLGDSGSVHRLQFYVHDVALLDGHGGIHSVAINDSAPWQNSRVALLDLADSKAAAPRAMIEGRAGGERYTGVRFSVGVPFDLNHANPLTAAAPLDRSDMFWTWQSGYKFLRVDLSGAEHEAAFHLGSTGCSSQSALRPPQQPCAQPNVIRVELTGFDPTSATIQVRADDIVAALANAEQRACTGNYASSGCAAAFEATGLDVRSGKCMVASTGDTRQGTTEDDARVCPAQRLFAVPR